MDLDLLRNNIVNLSRAKDGSADKSLKKAGLKKDLVNSIKNGSAPSIDKIAALAEYFGVTVDYLLTGKDNNTDNESPLEKELIGVYRHFFGVKQMGEEHRAQVLADIEMLKVFHNLNGIGQAAAIETTKGLTNMEELISEEAAQQIHA
jgi:transcriptional regulator with XRE-family HTH domain